MLPRIRATHGTSGLECGSTVLGFAFVDCAALKIWVGSVEDDSSYAALGALLMQVSLKEVIYEQRDLSKEAEKAIQKYSLTGSAATQITPVQLSKGFQDSKEVRNEIQLNNYFKGSGKLLDHLLDGVVHHEIALGALGGLIDNLSRLMFTRVALEWMDKHWSTWRSSVIMLMVVQQVFWDMFIGIVAVQSALRNLALACSEIP